MKKLCVILVLAVALVGCCSHPAEKAALDRIEVEFKDMSGKYLKYVEADPTFGGAALTQEQRIKARENERAWVKRVMELVVSVQHSLGD